MNFVALLLCSFFSLTALAEELTHAGHNIYIDNPHKWEIGKEFFGIPFILFSPQKNQQRSNISFAHTGVEMDLEVKALEKGAPFYQDNKKKWAQTHDALINEFYPYQSYLNTHQHRVHTIGISYTHQEKTYVENSYYVECKGKIVFSKSLRLKVNAEDEKYFKSLINSLDCGVI